MLKLWVSVLGRFPSNLGFWHVENKCWHHIYFKKIKTIPDLSSTQFMQHLKNVELPLNRVYNLQSVSKKKIKRIDTFN